MENAIKNDLRALKAFNPVVPDILVVQGYMGLRGMLIEVLEQVSRARSFSQGPNINGPNIGRGAVGVIDTILALSRQSVRDLEDRLGLTADDIVH
jgi:hypothetical protein